MEMLPVKSSAISSIGYDAEKKQAHVEFPSGVKYVYHDVEQSHFDELRNAPSIGKHFHANFKNNFKANAVTGG